MAQEQNSIHCGMPPAHCKETHHTGDTALLGAAFSLRGGVLVYVFRSLRTLDAQSQGTFRNFLAHMRLLWPEA